MDHVLFIMVEPGAGVASKDPTAPPQEKKADMAEMESKIKALTEQLKRTFADSSDNPSMI